MKKQVSKLTELNNRQEFKNYCKKRQNNIFIKKTTNEKLFKVNF
jgi:hypothetical protein